MLNSPDTYTFLLTFVTEHPFISWCALWLVWGPIGVIITLIQFAESLFNRTMRFAMVLVRGWPPAHLDADGDWPPADKASADDKSADSSAT